MQQTTEAKSLEPLRSRQWLATLLLRRGRLLPRFALFYQRLSQLPRQVRRGLLRKSAVSLAGAALLLALSRAPAVHAAAINVDNGQVAVANDGFCSLPEAILSAEGDNAPYASAGECEDGNGADTLYLPAGGNFTLTAIYGSYYQSLTSLPLVTSAITIEGNGSTIARDPNNSDLFRLLAVSSSGNLTLNQLTLSGGYGSGNGATAMHGGGAVFSNGTLIITDSTLSNNEAEYTGGAVAIFGLGTVTISDSTLSGNEARFGGGVYNATGASPSATARSAATRSLGAMAAGCSTTPAASPSATARSAATRSAMPAAG